ncbi:hypothetical protein O0L34_g15913 [Tuta absoluta]|nr:hypothetical protein O0L34_g15913 [Tuta absoluta]
MPNTTAPDVDVPPIYVNKDLLSDEEVPIGAEYVINEQVFRDTSSSSEHALAEFELFKMEPAGDMYCSTPDESENGDLNELQLHVTLQAVPNGYVVNGSCFLTWQQWHTLVTPHVSIKLLHCLVCSQYCEVDASRDHVVTVNHRLALESYPPLDKFDLSIVRKINDIYHCAVCNEKFDISSEYDHFSSKMHDGNQLFAINKASDILDNSVEQNDAKIDTYHFKTHEMNSSINDDESVGSNENYNNYNYVNFQNNYYFDDYEEETPAFTGLSYATMAKKPKVNVQSFIDIDLGHRMVTIRYDSWHMVITPKPNRLWCMVCKTFEHLRRKQQHCSQQEHLENLSRCRVREEHQEYFIRQVSVSRLASIS